MTLMKNIILNRIYITVLNIWTKERYFSHVKKTLLQDFIIPTIDCWRKLLLGSQLNASRKFGAAFENFHPQIILFPIPIAQIYTRKYLGLNLKHYSSIDIAVANTLSLAIVTAKTSDKEERPDQSDNLSSSGHTAIALHQCSPSIHEYQESSFWYMLHFCSQTATGFRVANNKHYASDVLTEP
jgi:hypothetical protein